MSWSFSVTEKTPGDARRVFANKVAEMFSPMPRGIDQALMRAARELTDGASQRQQTTIASHGHFNKDGSGNCEIRVIIAAPAELAPPNVPEESLGRDA